MSFFATLSGSALTDGTIAFPLYGAWSGDVTLASDTPVQTQTTLVMGNLTLTCAVVRQAVFNGQIRARVVGGYGGWRKPVSARQYGTSSGVKLSMVLRDVAAEVGEKVNVPNDQVVGLNYVRSSAAASDVLRQLAGANWYIDPSGVTQIAPWPTVNAISDFTAITQDGAQGVVIVATEDYATWLPGCTFTAPTIVGTLKNCGVLYTFDSEGQFRMQVMTQ